MEPHGGDVIARFLEERRIPFVFTLCGGHISPILTAARHRGLRVIDMRHEADAVFAAEGFHGMRLHAFRFMRKNKRSGWFRPPRLRWRATRTSLPRGI